MNSVRAADRAIDVLMLLAQMRRPLSISELQAGARLSRPTLYRMIETLAARGLVRIDGDPPRYTLDYGVLALADAWTAQVDVVRDSERILNELWQRTDETVALAVPLSDDRWVLVKELRSRQPLSYGRGVGHAHPLTVGASGRAIVSGFADDRVEAVLAKEPDAVRREWLRGEIAGIRRHGYGAATGELITGATAFAVPVFDYTGAVVASLCLYGPEIRVHHDPVRSRYVALMLDAAKRLCAILGHRPAHDAAAPPAALHPKPLSDAA